jgi:2-polyprenyl-3-methyl-5-hydroxy-6-metoxy-1,4-benzoquinol methylase
LNGLFLVDPSFAPPALMADVSEQSQFFDDAAAFFNWRSQTGQFRERERRFLAVARSVLAESSSAHPLCLDLGCGPGAITIELANLGFETIGVDASRAMIDLATKAVPKATGVDLRCTFTQADLGAFLEAFPREADLIVSSSVFEYLEDPVRIIELVAARLRPGGMFAVSLPNRRSVYRWVEPTLLLRKPKAMRYTREWRNTMGAEALIAEANAFGLDLGETSYFGQMTVKGRPVLARFTRFASVGTMTLVVLAKR